MTLLLICETSIINNIFTLVSKKLNLKLTIVDNIIEFKEEYDFIVVDHSYIDDDFNKLKQYTKKLAAICPDELPFDKSRDFIIPRPFLPTQLQDLLSEHIQIIKEENLKEASDYNRVMPSNKEVLLDELAYEEDEEVTIPVTDYVDSLVEDVALEIEDENDESIITLASLKEGGVLDSGEISKINDILEEEQLQAKIDYEEDWKDIVDIIDDALSEVREYEFSLNNNTSLPDKDYYELILNHYSINELKPFLSKLNQEIVDKLSAGEIVDLKIKLKESSGK